MLGEMSAPAQQIAAMKRRLLASLAFVISVSTVLVLFSILRDGAVVRDLELEKGSSSASRVTTEAARATPPASPPRCDLFSGRWVYENSSDRATYSEKGCSFMSEIVACEQFGRKDLRCRNWRWQPHACDLPRFDPKAMAEELRGKKMVFAGDSLTWNQWVSMVCLMESAMPKSHKTFFQPKGPLKFFRDMEYNISIEHHWTPMLVESNGDDPVHNQFPHRIARAESIVKHARRWTDADFLVFDNYVWWKMPQIRLQWGSFNNSDSIYKDVDSVRAYELAMATWATWLELHTNTSKTKLFFMSISPTHFRAKEWGGESKHNCYGETEPITKYGYRGRETDVRFERAAEEAIKGLRSRGVMVQLLNVTRLSEYRKDAHPSIYRQFWDTVLIEQRSDPTKYADCTHWCLPGVPDVWNQLLYAYIVSDLVDS